MISLILVSLHYYRVRRFATTVNYLDGGKYLKTLDTTELNTKGILALRKEIKETAASNGKSLVLLVLN